MGEVKAVYDWKEQAIPMIQTAGHGFQTGDIVKAVVPDVKMAGIHIGKVSVVSVRSTGRFNQFLQKSPSSERSERWR